MSSEEDLLKRVSQVRNLKENCFKYLEEESKELLTHKIIFAIAEITYEKRGPVKLAEIAQKIIGESDKNKQDLVRLTIDKSLLKCGIVEKLRYSANDVRYALTAYRFQKVKGVDSFRGESVEPIGKVYELPKSTWPIPDEFFILVAKKFGYGEALKKINTDFDKEEIPRGKYEDLIRTYTEDLNQITKKITSQYGGVEELVGSRF